MASFNSAILTEKGNELIVESAAGCQIEFTRLVTGSGIYDGTENMASMTALKEQRQEFQFIRYEKLTDKSILLVAIVSNESLSVGYRMTEVGIYGKLKNSEEEIFCSIATAINVEADFWPSFNGVAPSKMLMRYHITISAEATPCVSVGDDMVLTEISMESNRAQVAEQELKDRITENDTVVEALNAAIGNKVDKVEGKGLSTNDFTNEEKNKLKSIVPDAETVQSDWDVSDPDSDAFIKNKPGIMEGASLLADGNGGLVPAPEAGSEDRYLSSDGTWKVPKNNTTITNNYLATVPGTAADAMLAKELREDIDGLRSSFQAGCDTIVAGCTTYGATPASNSPNDIVDAIEKIYTDRYNAGQSVTKSANITVSISGTVGSTSGTAYTRNVVIGVTKGSQSLGTINIGNNDYHSGSGSLSASKTFSITV